MNINLEPEKFMNTELVESKTTTNDLYQDLVGYLNENVEMPDEKDKDMILQNIRTYYESLDTLLIKHTLEHPPKSKT